MPVIVALHHETEDWRIQRALLAAGLSTKLCGIIEIGAIADDSGERWETLVNPGDRKIESGAEKAHGISMATVQHPAVPTFRWAAPLQLTSIPFTHQN